MYKIIGNVRHEGDKMEDFVNESIDLCVPVYLDPQIVFDLLAMLENGFSQISTVNTSVKETKENNSKICGSLNTVLSLIGVSLDGEMNKSKGKEDSQTQCLEKLHTPSSLFSKLRLKLYEKELVHVVTKIDEMSDLKCGDFIEFRSNLINNPLIDNLNRIRELLILAQKLSNESNKSQKGNRKKSENEIISERLSELLDALMESNTTEIIGNIIEEPQINVDLSSKTSCFINNDASLIMNSEFYYVFGKVTKVISSASDDTINLLEKTTFRSFGEEFIKTFTDSFSKMPNTIMVIPEIRTKIRGPAIQVLPIAIFI